MPTGGGHATIAADYFSELGVDIPPLSEKTQARLREILPAAASVRNPVDVAGGADSAPNIFASCAKILLHDSDIGAVLVVGLFGGYAIRFAERLGFVEEEAAHRMGKLVRDSKKPVVVHSLYNYAKPHTLDLLRYYDIPVYDSLEIACKCIGVLADRGRHMASYKAKQSFDLEWGERAKERGKAIILGARAAGRMSLLETEAKELLALHGATVSAGALVGSATEAVEASERIDGPVALKVVSPQISHKSEAKGVQLGLETHKEIRAGYKRIVDGAKAYDPEATLEGILVSPMAPPGLEIIIGTKVDDQFGPVIMFGVGGTMVEILKDVSFRVLPISRRTAKLMIEDIKAKALLDEFRGRPAVDKKAIRQLLNIVGEVVEAYPEIVEMDLNPVLVYEEGLVVVDVRVLLGDGRSPNHT